MSLENDRNCCADCTIESHVFCSKIRLNAEQLSSQTGSKRSVVLLQGGTAAKQMMFLNAVSQLGSGGGTRKKEKPVVTPSEVISASPGNAWG